MLTSANKSKEENVVKLKDILRKGMASCINALAMVMVVQSANSACVWVLHQPEFPKEAEKYRK